MRTYILRRLLQLIPTLIAISLLIFTVMRIIPGDPIIGLLGDAYDEENAAALRKEYGLDRHIAMQYVIWLSHILQGDWGNSMLNGRSVLTDILWYLPVTI